MTTDEISKLIPDEVVEAAARVLHANAEVFHDVLWDDLGDYDQGAYRAEARAAIAAGLAEWPEAKRVKGYFTHDTDYYEPAIILPLTQEPSNV